MSLFWVYRVSEWRWKEGRKAIRKSSADAEKWEAPLLACAVLACAVLTLGVPTGIGPVVSIKLGPRLGY